jgi:uncharacterized protein YjbJ (UPF0337 family)
MSTRDKASQKAQVMKGKGKEAVGKLAGNQRLEREGKTEQSKLAIEEAGEDVKQAVASVKTAVTRK